MAENRTDLPEGPPRLSCAECDANLYESFTVTVARWEHQKYGWDAPREADTDPMVYWFVDDDEPGDQIEFIDRTVECGVCEAQVYDPATERALLALADNAYFAN